MLTQSEDSSLDLTILTKEEQTLCDIIPLVWHQSSTERAIEIDQVLLELRTHILQNPPILSYALRKINQLRHQSPYCEFVDAFYRLGVDLFKEPALEQVVMTDLLGKQIIVKKKRISKFFQDCDLAELLKICDYLGKPSEIPNYNKVVRRVQTQKLRESLSDWEDDETTDDPSFEAKSKLNIRIMNRLSFGKLQKLLCDLYTLGYQKITNLSQIYLVFPDYLKINTSIMKKIFHHQPEQIYLLAMLAASGQECEYMINEMAEKYILSGGEQTHITNGFSSLSLTQKKIARLFRILSQFPSQILCKEHSPIAKTDAVQSWSRQQLMQMLILFAIIQCECTVQQALGIQNEVTCNLEERISLIRKSQDISPSQDTSSNYEFQHMDLVEIESDSLEYSHHFLGNNMTPTEISPSRKCQKKLTSQEFNWSDNCYWVIKDVLPKLAHKLNKKYLFIQGLGLNKEYQFSQMVLGYQSIEKTQLSKGTQDFVRKVIHRPWAIRSVDYNQLDIPLLPHDIIRLVLVIANAKMFTQILFSMKALNMM